MKKKSKFLEELVEKDDSVATEEVVKPRKKLSYASKRRFKHGGIAFAFTAIFVAVVIMLNIGATILAQNVSLSVDLTAGKDFSISDKNKDYIKKIDRDVNIVVCCDKDTYQNSLGQYLYEYGIYAAQTSGGQVVGYTTADHYFSQNVYLLEQYSKLNKKITVEFVDPQSPDFNKYTNRYPDESFSMGSILVESTFELEGETINRHSVLGIYDTFAIDETYASSGMTLLTGNDIETVLTSKIYAVTSDRSYKVVVVTANGGKAITPLQTYLEFNNYEFEVIDSLVNKELPADADVIIISQPTYDYSEEELDKLDKYLELSAEHKKTVFYIGSSAQAKLTNLNEFLSEWGFAVTPEHTVYETDDSKYYYHQTNAAMSVVSDNGFTKDISRDDYLYLASNMVPITAKEGNNRTITTILQISNSAVAFPNDADESFKPEDAEVKGPFVGLGISQYHKYDSDNNMMTASVMVLNSSDFINTSFNNYSDVGNIEVLRVVLDTIVEKKTMDISFDRRTINTTTFSAPSGANTLWTTIFAAVLPLVIVLTICIVVRIRRRRS